MATEYQLRLHDAYRRAAEAGKSVMDRAAAENRDLTPDETEQRDRAYADVTRIKGEIDKTVSFDQIRLHSDVFANAPARVERATGSSGAPSLRTLFTTARSNGYASYDYAPTSAGLDFRALQSAGGSAVQTSFADFVTVYSRTATPMLRPDVVTMLNRTDGSPFVLPRLTADPSSGGTLTAEAGGIAELDATVSSIQLNPYKFAITNLWSAELAEDNTIGLENLVGSSTARELSISIGTALTTGTGSAQPQGFIGAATNGGTAAGTGTTYGTYFGPTDLVSLFYSLSAPDRATATWQANATTLAQVRNARATTGEFLWAPAFAIGEPETLLGRPIFENPAMANGSAAKAIAVGNFAAYHVAAVPLRVELSISYKFSTDQIALRSIWRVDGDLPDASGIRYLVNAAV
ncbi:MAG: phage major capsid protein [Chloroflexota bacterium]